jgi:hypothetical protein
MTQQSFWKIPKEWVQEWGLSWNEAGILADILDWNCTTQQHAARCVVSDRTVKNSLDDIAAKAEANEGLAKLLDSENFSEIFSKSNGKFFQKKRKIFPKKVENFSENFSVFCGQLFVFAVRPKDNRRKVAFIQA